MVSFVEDPKNNGFKVSLDKTNYQFEKKKSQTQEGMDVGSYMK